MSEALSVLNYVATPCFWELAYTAYIMVVVGTAGFFAVGWVSDDGVFQLMREGVLGRTVVAWLFGSYLIANYFWPLMLVGPAFLVTNMGAPIGAAMVCYGIAVLAIAAVVAAWARNGCFSSAAI